MGRANGTAKQSWLMRHKGARWVVRYLVLACGIVINSFGIAFITKSALGTSPISSVPYVASLQFEGISFGLASFILNMVFILVQIVLLRRDFKPVNFLQVLVNMLFSSAIDVSSNLLSWFDPTFIPLQLLGVVVGCMILAMGICIEVAPNVVLVPGEGVVRAIARVTKIRFGTVKICFDVTLAVIAVVMSFVFFGRLNGLGVGTVICAVIVGWFVNLFDAHVPFLRHIRALSN